MNPVRTMIADDNREFLQALRSFLASVPKLAVVGEANSGEDALAQAQTLAPDLLILDLMMPRQSGVDVLIRLGALPRRPRVIMLTLHAAEDYRALALAHGADDYVCKSNLVSDLPGAIERLFA